MGEGPGDREDRAGRPFVGPAGRELDTALAAVGIDRRTVYVTNAVKHFKFHERGTRRIHDKPTRADVKACAPWLRAELERVTPEALVLLGATAAGAVLGRAVTLEAIRDAPIESPLAVLIATTHPSAILRAPDGLARQRTRDAMVEDLRLAGELVGL